MKLPIAVDAKAATVLLLGNGAGSAQASSGAATPRSGYSSSGQSSGLKQEIDRFRQQRLNAAVLRHCKMAQLRRRAGVEVPTDVFQAGAAGACRGSWRGLPAVEGSREFVSHWR